jgi:hypothetical protein
VRGAVQGQVRPLLCRQRGNVWSVENLAADAAAHAGKSPEASFLNCFFAPTKKIVPSEVGAKPLIKKLFWPWFLATRPETAFFIYGPSCHRPRGMVQGCQIDGLFSNQKFKFG